MPPICSFCDAFAVVVTTTERVNDGGVLDQRFHCYDCARSNNLPTGGPALSLVAPVEAAPEMGQ